jgi:hypothetical protein
LAKKLPDIPIAEFDMLQSPAIEGLCLENGDKCEGNTRTNIPTSATVAVSKQAELLWSSHEVLFREMLQNLSDAVIRCVAWMTFSGV